MLNNFKIDENDNYVVRLAEALDTPRSIASSIWTRQIDELGFRKALAELKELEAQQ